MFCHLMQNKLLSVDGELEKDRFNGLETRELNDTEKFTSPVLWRRERSYFIFMEVSSVSARVPPPGNLGRG